MSMDTDIADKPQRTPLQHAVRTLMRTLEKLPKEEQEKAIRMVGAYFGLEVR